MLKLAGVEFTKCPCCKTDKMQLVEEISYADIYGITNIDNV
jgi:hypothetical protein